jgi:hypothetical protein
MDTNVPEASRNTKAPAQDKHDAPASILRSAAAFARLERS